MKKIKFKENYYPEFGDYFFEKEEAIGLHRKKYIRAGAYHVYDGEKWNIAQPGGHGLYSFDIIGANVLKTKRNVEKFLIT